MINELLLLSGNDIPFPEARVTIHPPTLKEIAYIGEESFFVGCGFLDFSKNLLSDLDKNNLKNYNDFDIFMKIIKEKNKDVAKSVEAAFMVLNLIFPLYKISVRENLIILKQDDKEYSINKNNFSEFKKIISAVFNLKMGEQNKETYNPSGDMSQRIANKFKKRHEHLNKIKGITAENKKI